MHPEEQQLEGWGEEPPIRLGMGEGGEQRPGIRPRPSQEGRRDGKRGGLLWGVVVTRDNSVTKAHTPPPARGKGAGRRGTQTDGGERERGADWSRLHGGDFMAHSAGVEDITEVMKTSRGAAPPRQHPEIHRCDAARVLTRATPRRRRGRAWRRGRRRSARAPPPPRRPPTLPASPRARRVRRRRGSRPPPRR